MGSGDLLRRIDGFIFDIDGCLIKGKQPLPGAIEAIRDLKVRGKKIAVFTNDSAHPSAYWSEKLRGMGFDIDPAETITSGVVAAEFVKEKFPGRKILLLGTEGLEVALKDRGLTLIDLERSAEAEVVVMGKDPAFNYHKLERAMNAILQGAEFVATNLDRRIPLEKTFAAGTGPMVQALAWAAGREPVIMGKPSRWAGEMALRVIGVARERGAMVGDQIDQDIAMGKNAGLYTILVLSGTTREADVARAPAGLKPDLILPDITHLFAR